MKNTKISVIVTETEYYKCYRMPNGEFHREDGPAMIWSCGHQIWYLHGKFHREDGPASVDTDGHELWYLHGKLHRVDGPAKILPRGSKYWYRHGNLHRVDGPAAVRRDGTFSFWINNVNITHAVRIWIKESNLPHPKEWTNRERAYFRLRWG